MDEQRCTEEWQNSQAQRVGISSTRSCWRLVGSRILLGSILDPDILKAFTHDLDDGAEHTLCLYTTKLGGVADNAKGCAALQRVLIRLEK